MTFLLYICSHSQAIMLSTIKTIFLTISFVLCLPAFSIGQRAWSLQQCVEHALKNNISVKQSEISMEQAKISMQQKKWQLVPSLNGSVSDNYNFGRSVDPTTYRYTNEQIQSANFSLSSNLTLFNGFQLQNELRQSQLDYMAGKFDLQKIKDDISINVTSAFLQVLYAKEQLGSARNRLNQSEKERDRTKALTEAGSLTQGNFLDAEAQLANDELAVINAENQYVIANLSLAQLLELDSSDSMKVEEPVTNFPDVSILSQSSQEIFQMAEQSLPEMKGSIYKVRSAEKGLAIAKGARSPRLSMFGSMSTGYSSAAQRPFGTPTLLGLFPNGDQTTSGEAVLSPLYSFQTEKTSFSDQWDQNNNKAVGFSLSIPLFNGWSVGSNISRAKLNLKNAEYGSELTRKLVYKSIQQAYADAIGAQKKFAAAQKSKDALSASFNYTEKKYNAGLISSLDFLTIKNNLARAESDFIQAKYDYIFRVKVLDFYAGKPLTL